MAKELKYGVTLNSWETLLASLEANGGDFPQLETYRQQLGEMLTRARQATIEQAAMAASKQDASKRLKALLADGRKLASCLALLPPPAFRPAPAPAELSPGTEDAW